VTTISGLIHDKKGGETGGEGGTTIAHLLHEMEGADANGGGGATIPTHLLFSGLETRYSFLLTPPS